MKNIYKINNEKFKSIIISVSYTMQCNEKENSENAVLASILNKTNSKYKTQKDIEKYLYNLYGANFDTIVEKYGDLYNIEFKIECINKKYLPNNEDVVNECIAFLQTMIYEPDISNGKFDDELVAREKNYILNRIKERKDDKLQYAVSRTEELLTYPDPFGTYVYGNEQLVEKITAGDIYKRYLSMINNACITVMVSGNLEGYSNIEQSINEIFGEKIDSKVTYENLNYDVAQQSQISNEIKEITETQDTTQSVVTFGFKIKEKNPEQDFYILNLYNAVLGTTPSSKLFTNFREKESLAYVVRSRYYRYKSIIVIFAGIQKSNYEKSKEVVLQQINDIESGNVSDEEFDIAKQSLVSDLMEWHDSKTALAKMLLSNLIVYKNDKVTIDTMIEKIKQVTKQDVIDIAKRIELEQIFLLGGEADV